MDKIQPTEAEIEVAKRFQTIGRALIYRKVSDSSKYNCYYADNYEYAGFHFDEPRGFFIQLELMQEILSLRQQLETAKEKSEAWDLLATHTVKIPILADGLSLNIDMQNVTDRVMKQAKKKLEPEDEK